MDRIQASVGRKGTNRSDDVVIIQKLLNAQIIPVETTRLIIDEKIGKATIARIESFQKKVLEMAYSDGRVDPNGRTFKELNKSAIRPGAKSASTYTFSTKGIDLLKSIEELATTPYDDQTGKNITTWVVGATIGYGHLISNAEWSIYKNGITETQATNLFNSDLIPYANAVKARVFSDITQNEFDALVILAFNIGEAAFIKSSVLKLVNDPSAITSYTSLEAAWKAWNKSQGVVNKGLTNRREAEWNIFNKGVYKKW